MDFLFGNLNGACSKFSQEIAKCPFLKNINEPTNFSFSAPKFSSLAVSVNDVKGPIFEDGPSFDMAFRVFHGQNGVIPLPESPYFKEEESATPSPLQFNPLAANAASISLSGFGPGGPFGFDAFFGKGKNSKKGGKSGHEASGDEWLRNGNCPIAKSYRAVIKVVPLVAKTLKPPSGIKYKCPAAIVAARSALSKTAFAKNLRPQPLPAKILAIGALGMAVNIPLGVWREHTEKFSPAWFVAVHAAVPFIGMLRKSVLMPKEAMAFTIAASILGQVLGSRAERYRLKKKLELDETSSDLAPHQSIVPGGRCSDVSDWTSVSLPIAVAPSSTQVF